LPRLKISFLLREFKSGIKPIIGILNKRIVFGGPRSIALIMSKECNSKCIMCWYHSPAIADNECQAEGIENKKPQFMDHRLCEKIIREAHQIGTFRFILGGHGEPLLHPQFDNILNLLIKLKKAPYVITNGLAIDEKYAKYLAAKPVHYRISMHAGDLETWLRVHPTSSESQLETLSRAIKLLAGSGVARVSLMNVIQKANFRHINEILEYARKLGVKNVLFLPVRADGNLTQVVLDSNEELELKEGLKKSLILAEGYGISTNIKDYLSTNRFIKAGAPCTSELYRNIPCYIGWIYTEFDIDGTMRPCENSDLSMGNAGEKHLKEMWFSKKYQDFRYESLRLPLRNELVKGCKCQECTMSKFNINVNNLLSFKSMKYGEA